MTCREFEEALDGLLVGTNAIDEDRVDARQLSPSTRDHLLGCTRCQRLFAEWQWLHQQIGKLPAPEMGDGFTQRVVARLRTEHAQSATEKTAAWHRRPLRWAMTAGLALAATLTALAIWLPEQPPTTSTVARTIGPESSPGEQTDLDSGDLTGEIRVALAENFFSLTNILRLETEGPILETTDSPGQPAVSPANTSADSLQAPPLQEVLRGSSGTLAAASRGFGTSMRPITDSAAGAFGFLWRDLTAGEEKPST